MDAKPVTESLLTYFRATPIPLICAYLFGSHARGEQRPSSEVDVAVLLPADVRPSLTGPLTMLRGDLERAA
jgi:predicted nucleotidyltransferase